MKQFIWAFATFTGFLFSASALSIEIAAPDEKSALTQNWTEVTGLPGQLSDDWALIETDLATIWLLQNQDDPNLLGRISTQQIDDSIQLDEEVDAIAESFRFQKVNLHRSTKTYGNITTEQLEISTKDGNQDVSGIFILMNYQDQLYTLMLASQHDLADLQRHKQHLLNSIFEVN